MKYGQLDYVKRCQILAFWKAGHNQTEIAKKIGVHKSTISRELKRNITYVRTQYGSWQYKPDYAQHYATERHKEKNKCVKFTKQVNENTSGLVRQYLKKGADFSNVDDESLAIIMDKLNNRPRKSLGYATPNEAFNSS